jgi:three-Cys-motif partner protein
VTPRREDDCICSDGLRGRSSGEWARTKLQFINDYVPPALAITHKIRRRWFLDLFAGPGRNRDRHRSPGEFDGSPLRALELVGTDRAQTPFTDAIFINKEPCDHEALEVRVNRMIEAGHSRIPRDRIKLVNANANEVLPTLMGAIGTFDYVVAFADITAPSQLPLATVRELRRRGHRSVDFYALFPLAMALIRQLSFSDDMMERYAPSITAFFETNEWREIRQRRRTSGETPQLKAELIDLYLRKLRTIWQFAGEQERIGRSERQRLYRMFFATDHPLAQRLADWQKGAGQQELFG